MKINSKVLMVGGLVVGLFLLTRKRASGGNLTPYPYPVAGGLLDSSGNPIPKGYYQDEYGAIVRSMFG